VVLVSVNTYQIAHKHYFGVFLVGTAISIVWAWNVKRIVFGTWPDRLIYALGAGIGSLSGLLISAIIYE
jgi:Na+(H+)/acetate symporter ActP